ncbi:hypothetical protein [Acidovorax sp.]|uniref:hypothetical protein n=1 Tax=Acidovorax sp. TaxID=1872122 RepID=UPI0025C26CEF|nr:hypothetical protein [Acidovorax sp.]MBL7091580.1 hypothetical protein [Acidovorax sp.]
MTTATSLITALAVVHWVSGLIVLAEALNKLERTAPCRRGLRARDRITEWLKAIAWALLAVGGAGALITPLLPLEQPTLQDACVLLGFATLIVRTRVKEG